MAQDTILGKSLRDFLQGTQKLKKGSFWNGTYRLAKYRFNGF